MPPVGGFTTVHATDQAALVFMQSYKKYDRGEGALGPDWDDDHNDVSAMVMTACW